MEDASPTEKQEENAEGEEEEGSGEEDKEAEAGVYSIDSCREARTV